MWLARAECTCRRNKDTEIQIHTQRVPRYKHICSDKRHKVIVSKRQNRRSQKIRVAKAWQKRKGDGNGSKPSYKVAPDHGWLGREAAAAAANAENYDTNALVLGEGQPGQQLLHCPGDWSECCTTSSQLRGDGKHKSFARFAFTTIHSWLNQSSDVSCQCLLSAKFNEHLVISLSHMLFYLHSAPVHYFN